MASNHYVRTPHFSYNHQRSASVNYSHDDDTAESDLFQSGHYLQAPTICIAAKHPILVTPRANIRFDG